MTSEDGAWVQGAVANLPTHDPGLDVSGAPPRRSSVARPTRPVRGSAKAELDQTVATQRQQGRPTPRRLRVKTPSWQTAHAKCFQGPEIAKGGAAAAKSGMTRKGQHWR